MQTFKRFVSSVACSLIVVVVFSAIVVEPFLHSKMEFFQDNERRSAMAGTIDTLIVGASQLECGLVPSQMNAELNCVSYNLSSGLMNMNSRRYMIERECARNPVKRVIIDISTDALTRPNEIGNSLGDLSVVCRMDSDLERFSYVFHEMNLETAASLTGRVFNSGILWWYRFARMGHSPNNADSVDCGFLVKEAEDLTVLTDEELAASVPMAVGSDALSYNIIEFQRIVDYCNSNNIELVVVAAPVPKRVLERYDVSAWEKYRTDTEQLCQAASVSYYDFNRSRAYCETYSDKASFSDGDHLSEAGAKEFTHQICSILQGGKNVQDEFFPSYEEAIVSLR